ncbi:MAG: liaS [Thermoleophilia bacterium]|nr:liaS [Thermoleophilia bacterium]
MMAAGAPGSNEVADLHRRLHDGVLQLLEFMSSGGLGTIDVVSDYRRLASSAAADLRAVIEQPLEVLDDRFPDAMRDVVAGVATRGREMELRVELCDRCSDVVVADVQPLLLATGEAVLNAVRHSGGRRVLVSCTRSVGHLTVDVLDDGAGLPRDYRAGFGVQSSIIGRISEAGGRVRIGNGDASGAHVRLELPVAPHPIAEVRR